MAETQLFKVRMRRKGAEPITIFTQAASKDQAERFAHFRKPGFTVVEVLTEEEAHLRERRRRPRMGHTSRKRL